MSGQLVFHEDGHRYEYDGGMVPSVTQILQILSNMVYGDIDTDVLHKAAERGTRVHQLTEELDLTRELKKCPAHLAGYLRAYAKFLREHDVKWEASELSLLHNGDLYAGTIDRRGWVDGYYCTVDLKTAAQIYKVLVKAQLNGYERMARDNGLRPADKLFCLSLHKTGKYTLYEVAIDDAEFCACLILHNSRCRKQKRGKIV